MSFEYRAATNEDLENIWDKDLIKYDYDEKWVFWKQEYMENNKLGKCKTFVIVVDNKLAGQGTLLFSPECSAVGGRTCLADGKDICNINALRIEKELEDKGYISGLVQFMEEYALKQGYKTITIGVEASETRTLGIYLHWGYDKFIMSEVEKGILDLYYSKKLDHLNMRIDHKNYDQNSSVFHRAAARGIIRRGDEYLFVRTRYGDYKFPGGGTEMGEYPEQALIREVKEETGYEVKPDSIQYYGVVHEKRRGEMEDIIRMDSHYFLCDVVNDEERELDEFGMLFDTEAVWMTLDKAIRNNQKTIDLTASPWIIRDTKVMNFLAVNLK